MLVVVVVTLRCGRTWDKTGVSMCIIDRVPCFGNERSTDSPIQLTLTHENTREQVDRKNSNNSNFNGIRKLNQPCLLSLSGPLSVPLFWSRPRLVEREKYKKSINLNLTLNWWMMRAPITRPLPANVSTYMDFIEPKKKDKHRPRLRHISIMSCLSYSFSCLIGNFIILVY